MLNLVIQVPSMAANVYFIQTATSTLMIDTGMSARRKSMQAIFASAGIEPEKVSLIIITHVHSDHVGGLAMASELSGAKVLCHRSGAENLETGMSEPVVGSSRLGSFIAAIAPKRFKGVRPDILVEDEFDLNEFGLDGKIVHTPGHSSASVTIVLANGETLVGDQIRDHKGELSLGMFYEDRNLLMQNLEKVAGYGSRILYMSHGGRTDNRALWKFIEEQKHSLAEGERS